MKSLMNVAFTHSALVTRGWKPYNQNTLDCALILATAPDSVQEECDGILRSRGITLDHTTRSVLYSQQDLFAVGSGRLAGGADVGQQIANTVASVNLSGYTASGIMLLMNDNERKNKARRSHQESEAAVSLSPEELKKRYKESSFLTAGQVFGNGNGRLGVEARDEVICRNQARKDKEAAVVSRKKTKLRGLISSAKVILDKMKNKTYKLNRKELLVLVRYKHVKGDQKIPSAVADLRA